MTESPNIPIYAHIKRELKNRIDSGELVEGALVPSEFELAAEYQVSRTPTRQALRDLELEGYITRSPGRGSFVAPRACRKKTTSWGARTFAVACPHVECHYTRDVVEGFVQGAAAEGYHTMVYFLRFSNDAEYDFLADVRNSGIEGIAIWLQHTSEQTRNLLQQFKRASFPVILIDRFVPGLETDFVVTDNEDMGYELTRALIARGHRTVGFVTCDVEASSSQERFSGYRRALFEAEIPYADALHGEFDPDVAPPGSVVTRIMAHANRPTAFFCINNGVADILLDALSALGYTVPDNVELAIVDDNRFAEAAGVPLITAEQRGLEMGRVGAELLIARVSDPQAPLQQRYLKADFRLGEENAALPNAFSEGERRRGKEVVGH